MSIIKVDDHVQVNQGSSVYHGCNGVVTKLEEELGDVYVSVVLFGTGDELLFDEHDLVFAEIKEEKISPYHTKAIAKGVYGEASKIFEEIAEFEDAQDQASPVLELCELVDVIGAIEGYTMKRFNISLNDLVKMTEANKRAFENGHRT